MRILWTDSAQHSQDAAADYIFEEFGAIPLHEFYNSLDEIEENLLFFSEMGKVEPLLQDRSKLYRSIVAAKYNKIIYFIDGNTIYIVGFWDTRREPKKQAMKTK